MVTASNYLSSSYSSLLQCYIRIMKITPKVEIEVRYVMDKKICYDIRYNIIIIIILYSRARGGRLKRGLT